MTKIPDHLSLVKSSVPSGAMPIARMRPVSTGLQELGAGLMADAGKMTDEQVAKARADFLVLKAKQDSAYENDEDFETVQERYTEAVEGGLGEVAGTIGDASARNRFVDDMRPSVAVGIERAKDIAWGQKADYELGGLKERLNSLREAGLTGVGGIDPDTGETMDPITESASSANQMIDSAVANNYMSAESAAESKRLFRESLALGKIQMMPPEQRMDALKQKWASFIPSDRRAQLMREAEEHMYEEKAQTIVDEWAGDSEIDTGEFMDRLRKIGDKRLRDKIETEWHYQNGQNERVRLEEQRAFRDKYLSKVQLGDMKQSQIPRFDWKAMDAPTKTAIINAERARASGKTKLEFRLDHFEKRLKFEKAIEAGIPGAGTAMYNYFHKIAHEMNEKQQRAWAESSIDGDLPDQQKSTLTDQQYMNGRLSEKGDVELRREAILWAGDWRDKYVAANKKEPSITERNKAFDDYVYREYKSGWWLFGSDKRMVEMDEDEQQDVLDDLQEENPHIYAVVDAHYRKKDIVPTPSERAGTFRQLQEHKGVSKAAAPAQAIPTDPPSDADTSVTMVDPAPPVNDPEPYVNPLSVRSRKSEVKEFTSADYRDMTKRQISDLLAKYKRRYPGVYDEVEAKGGTEYGLLKGIEDRMELDEVSVTAPRLSDRFSSMSNARKQEVLGHYKAMNPGVYEQVFQSYADINHTPSKYQIMRTFEKLMGQQ